MQTLAITGATGFLGRHLVAEIESRARYRLRLLTRNSPPSDRGAAPSTTVCSGNLLDLPSLTGFLEPDCTVIHLAYLHGSAVDNIAAAVNLASAARRVGVRRVVHCSTAVVVGFAGGGLVTEDTIAEPAGEYQRTKYKIEEVLRAGLSPDVELVIIRPTEIIGPGGQGLRTMIKRLRSGMTCKNALLRYLLGNRRFNYVSVHNVVAALLLLADTPLPQHADVYHVSDDDDPDNYYDAVERIIRSALGQTRAHGRPFAAPMCLLAMLFRLRPTLSPPNRVYSNAKISHLGYRRVMSLRAAISELVSCEAHETGA